jgi:hypothetical protein
MDEIDFSTISPPALVSPKIISKEKKETVGGSYSRTPKKKIEIDKYFDKDFIKNYFS